MFKLFGKKHADPPEEAPAVQASALAKHPEAVALAAQFDQEEFDILAVTGANGFGGDKVPEAEFWTATLPLVAWREGDGPIHEEDTCLVSLADDILLDYLKRRAQKDSIIQARVRQGLEDDRFLLVGLPTPIMDSDLKAILDEKTREVSTWVSGLGTFVLNRSVNWYQADVEWLDQPIQLTYDPNTEEATKDTQMTALALMSDQAGWDQRIRAYAADKLLPLAGALPQDEEQEESEAEEVTPEEFMSRIELESIQTYPDGRFAFWFHDGDLSSERSIQVSGSLSDGPSDANIEE
ncbi:MAG: DUF2262 domain-containing protein [Lawsonibacter sp.]|nr:DUF2262 domain-containing protein [Lawsonibacter sp.]